MIWKTQSHGIMMKNNQPGYRKPYQTYGFFIIPNYL